MAATFAERFVVAKDGIGTYLETTSGLTAADGVTVRTAAVTPEEFTGDMLILGDITAPQTQVGLGSRAASPTMPCWVVITRPGGDEAAIRATRARAAAVMALAEAALKADPSAAQTVTNPGRIVVTTSGLEESPVDWQRSAARRATIPFTLSWTSHIT